MKEIKVMPILQILVNWTGVSLFCRDIGIPDPIKALDIGRIKHNDPAALIQGLGCPEYCVIGFFVYCPNCTPRSMLSLTTAYGLKSKQVALENNDVTLLLLGNFVEWQNAIRLGCSEQAEQTDREVFNKIFEAIELTGLKVYFKQYRRKQLNDGSFTLCL